LITYETELDGQHTTPEAVPTGINRLLHSVATHLHRYLSELMSLQGIVVDLLTHDDSIYGNDIADGKVDGFEHASRGLFSQVPSQIEALYTLLRS
jgi:hypothetical protein